MFIIILYNPFKKSDHSPSKTISKKLDQKYGFKDLQFGMTYQQLRKIVGPVKVEDRKKIDQKIVYIENTTLNKIGVFNIGRISCQFFQNKLYITVLALCRTKNWES